MVFRSAEQEKSEYDIAFVRDEQWADELNPTVEWLAGDGQTAEVKSDERAFETGNVFLESDRTNGVLSGFSVSTSTRWIQNLGRMMVVMDTARMRAGVLELHARDKQLAPRRRGGDFDGTWGYCPTGLSVLQGPVAGNQNVLQTPHVYEVTFEPGSLAAAVALTPGGAALKDVDSSMAFPKDLLYGEDGENYDAALLGALPHASTVITDRTGVMQTRKREVGGVPVPHVNVEFKRNGVNSGIADTNAHLWLIDVGGTVLVCPVPELVQAARDHYHGGHTTLPGPEAVEVVRIPLWAPPEKASGIRPHGLMFCTGSELPDGLPRPPARELVA